MKACTPAIGLDPRCDVFKTLWQPSETIKP
jgi:hypothetical protein